MYRLWSVVSLSHHSLDLRETHAWLRIDGAFGASCSNRTVFLNLSGCSSCAVSDPLLPMWISLSLFSSCSLSLVLDRCDRMSIRHLLIISVPVFHRHTRCTSFPLELIFSLSLTLSWRLCLCMHTFRKRPQDEPSCATSAKKAKAIPA